MRKRVIFIRSSIFLILAGIVFWFSTSEHDLNGRAEKDGQMCKGNARPIPFKRLSDERSFPFLTLGRPHSSWPETSYYDELRASVAHFPNVRSCLVNSESGKQVPNLALFNWAAIKGIRDAEVCTFRVFSSIGTIVGSKQWLESQGFKKVYMDEVSILDLNGEEIIGKRVNALWYTRECGTKFKSNAFDELWQHFLAHAFWMSVWFTPDEEVNSTSAGFDIE